MSSSRGRHQRGRLGGGDVCGSVSTSTVFETSSHVVGDFLTRIALVSCAKKKRQERAPARDLYLSELFRRYRAYAIANADRWYILSAKHGLLNPDQVIAPYDCTLNAMSAGDRRDWATRVRRQLRQCLPPGAEVVVLAGSRYREGIEAFLTANGFSVSVPFKGLGIGKQLQQLMPYAGT